MFFMIMAAAAFMLAERAGKKSVEQSLESHALDPKIRSRTAMLNKLLFITLELYSLRRFGEAASGMAGPSLKTNDAVQPLVGMLKRSV